MSDGKTGLQLRSLLKKSGELELSLANVPTPEPGPDEVVVRVEATPINPSDLGLLIAPPTCRPRKSLARRFSRHQPPRCPEAAMSANGGAAR